MGGTETDSKRKRKRKTRSERNQVARHLIPNVDDKQERNKSKTGTTEKASCTTYSLRSGKAVSCPMKNRKTNGLSITTGRLTRKVDILANFPSSDWISREKSDLKSTRKKTDKKTKEKSLVVETEKAIKIQNAVNMGNKNCPRNKVNKVDSSAGEQDIMLISDPGSCPSQGNLSAASSNVLTKKSSSHGSVSPASNSSSKSMNAEEYLDPMLPYQEIAHRIGQDLKLKMGKMYPSRNIEMDICSNLQKLLKQSSQRISGSDMSKDISFKNEKYATDSCESIFKEIRSEPMDKIFHYTPVSESAGFCLTAVASAATADHKNSDTNLNMQLGDGEAFLSQDDGTAYLARISPYTPPLSVLHQHQQVPLHDPPHGQVSHGQVSHGHLIPSDSGLCNEYSFNTTRCGTEVAPPKPMSNFYIPRDEESEKDELAGLRLASYHSFMLSSYKLKQKQMEGMEVNIQERAEPFTDSSAKKCVYPYCACKALHHHNLHHGSHHYRHSAYTGKEPGHHNLLISQKHPAVGRSLTHPGAGKDREGRALSHLDISRHRFRTALESASNNSHRKSINDTLLGFGEMNNPNGIIFPDADRHPSISHSSEVCMDYSCSDPSLDQMKIHQTELQYQARDFLDELDQQFNQSRVDSPGGRFSLLSDSGIHGCERGDSSSFSWKGPSTQ